MVTDRPTRGVALGGASAEVGAVCRRSPTTSRRTRPAAERLARARRPAAVRRPARGVLADARRRSRPAAASSARRSRAGVETVVVRGRRAARRRRRGDRRASSPRSAVPVRSDGCVVGVLEVAARARRCAPTTSSASARGAPTLGRRIAALGGAARRVRRPAAAAPHDQPGRARGARRDRAAPSSPRPSTSWSSTPPRCCGAPRAPADASRRRPARSARHLRAAADRPRSARVADCVASRRARRHGAAHDRRRRPRRCDGAARRPAHQAVASRALPRRRRPTPRRGVLLLAGARQRAVAIDDRRAARAARRPRRELPAHRRGARAPLRERAATDPLTGLGHHATFHETLARDAPPPEHRASLLCDIDGFKGLNDSSATRPATRSCATSPRRCSGALRRGDTLFRIGGDEFAALLAVADADEALEAGAAPARRRRRRRTSA